jgi:geranylgeranyl pyrophosphate synthase
MRAANHLFNGDLDRLTPRKSSPLASRAGVDSRSESTTNKPDPLTRTEDIALDWLRNGGKRFRPFITLAAYDALKGAPGTLGEDKIELTDPVRRAALAIETFHKASLVHDDIEDDDAYRYGQETLHRRFGIGPAINVGDYLIGLGYRLVGRDRKELGGECAADILNKLADAHLKLSEGQGAELLWRDAPDKSLTPLDALKIYALKTSPAFEAALYSGLRLAGPSDAHEKMVTEFSRHLGVAFQILNDLKDWQGDDDNKLLAGQDVLAARPTLLLALALEAANSAERQQLLAIIDKPTRDRGDVERIRRIFDRTQAFTRAEALIDKYRARAETLADGVEPVELRELLYFLVDQVLAPEPPNEVEDPTEQLLQLA